MRKSHTPDGNMANQSHSWQRHLRSRKGRSSKHGISQKQEYHSSVRMRTKKWIQQGNFD